MSRTSDAPSAGSLVRLAGSAFAAALMTLAANPGAAFAQVQWRTGPGPVPTRMAAPEITGAVRTLAARPAATHVLASFDRPLLPAERTQVEQAGLRLLDYVGGNAYFAALDPAAMNPEALSASKRLLRVEPLQHNWKLHPDLASNLLRSWTITKTPQIDPQEIRNGSNFSVAALARHGIDPTVVTLVTLHANVVQADGVRAVLAHRGAVVSQLSTVNALVVELPYSQIPSLADEDVVEYLEPPMPALDAVNDSARAQIGANIVQAAPYNLNGQGVNVFVWDVGKVSMSHPDLTGRVTWMTPDSPGEALHSTHVAGTIGGTGMASGGTFKGMAPAVHFSSAAIEGFSQGGLYTNPDDMEADFRNAFNNYSAHIANTSMGSNVEPNGYPCDWEGDYGLTSQVLDALIRGDATHAPIRSVWAAGNERQGSRCNTQGGTNYQGYRKIAPPAPAKNQIAVGALNSNDSSVTNFTSWGPTDDGRLKPEISGPGCQSNGDLGVTSTVPGGGYAALCGTSMASPSVCGIGALILQDYRVHYPTRPDPRNSTLKAIFAQTARDIVGPGGSNPPAGPDYQTGYGAVQAQQAIDLVRSGNVIENTINATGDVYRALVVVAPTDTQLKVTIAWDDVPATLPVTNALVNDLDLVVTSPSGVRAFPWTLNPAQPAAAAVRTQEDHLNNLEQVQVDNPEPGAWQIVIRGTNIPTGSQAFSMTAAPYLVNCSTVGLATVAPTLVNCQSVLTLNVIDCDLNTSNQTVDTVTVNVASTLDTTGLSVLLTETDPASAVFSGTVQLGSVSGPGVLGVSDGGTVTLTYTDADDGQGHQNVPRTASANLDCVPPVISGVSTTNIQIRSATVNFIASEPGTAAVRYGTACGQLTSTAPAPRGTTQSINLTGLFPSTTYFYAIDAHDDAGNTGTDDNHGSCYTFTTPRTPDLFTTQFNSGFSLSNTSVMFTPGDPIDFYSACSTTGLTQLPNNPVGVTAIPLGHDGYSQISLVSGATVRFYGQTYSSFFVGSNGYITFGQGDSSHQATLDHHFGVSPPNPALARISALFQDLDPSGLTPPNGITWRQLFDRAVVSYINVPSTNPSTSLNTFQVELFFDGKVRLSFLNCGGLGALAPITGLARGNGYDAAIFTSSNLASYPTCAPLCPIDLNGDGVTTVQDFLTYLQLYANGDLRADFTHDGAVTVFDFLVYVQLYAEGC
jgi:subtilisin family serine protease